MGFVSNKVYHTLTGCLPHLVFVNRFAITFYYEGAIVISYYNYTERASVRDLEFASLFPSDINDLRFSFISCF